MKGFNAPFNRRPNPLGTSRRHKYVFVHADICDGDAMASTFREHRPDAVMHLAAETHVDRSIDGPAEFIRTNVQGTFTLLLTALEHWRGLAPPEQARFRFHHISTDEVFGSLGPEGLFTERSPYQPRSPYSASKAASDHLASSWHHTYGLPVVLSNTSNNYGPYQYPEKLIPVMVRSAVSGRPLPVDGEGRNVRDWLHVDDHAQALLTIVERGQPGDSYNVGARQERSNLNIVHAICALVDELRPDSPHRPHDSLIDFVTDRPGHDFRYAIDPGKIERELGWRPRRSFEEGLRETVSWYLDNEAWCRTVSGGEPPDLRRGVLTSSAAT